MFAKALAALTLGLVVATAAAGDAEACACCSEPGARVESTAAITTYEKDEMARLRFAPKATLYTDASGFDTVKGIASPATDYTVTETMKTDVFTFNFKAKSGKSGTLSFAVPANLESFFVDTQPDGSTGEPSLYKEWRLSAPVTASGIFAGSSSKTPPTARLILHGQGNMCTDAAQLTHWTLEVSGPNASFKLFGTLAKPRA